MDRDYRLDKIIIPTPYCDRGCYNCRYHTIKVLNSDKLKDNYCEIHKCDIWIWKWCEGWEKE